MAEKMIHFNLGLGWETGEILGEAKYNGLGDCFVVGPARKSSVDSFNHYIPEYEGYMALVPSLLAMREQ